jgi:hypothetical protein
MRTGENEKANYNITVPHLTQYNSVIVTFHARERGNDMVQIFQHDNLFGSRQRKSSEYLTSTTTMSFKRCIGTLFLLLSGRFSTVNSLVMPWALYHTSLSTHPLLTKSCTSAAIMSLSDAFCQRLERSNVLSKQHLQPCDTGHHHDFRRTRDVAVTGLFWGGPLSHTWYSVLETLVTTRVRLFGLIIRIILDATIFSPIAIFGYLTVRSLLAGQRSVAQLRAKLSLRYKRAVLSAWKFRPTANISECCFFFFGIYVSSSY